MADLPEIQPIKPFLVHSKELEVVHPVLSFYLKSYAVDRIHQTFKKLKGEGRNVDSLLNWLQTLITELEAGKTKLGAKVSDKEANKREITDFIMQLFYKSDEDERNGVVSKGLAQNFQVCCRFLESLSIFGPLPTDLNEKRLYSKAKAVEVAKKLKNPELYQKKEDTTDMELEKEMEKINKKHEQISGSDRQSVFNQIPKVLKKSNLYDEQSVNRIVDFVNQSQPGKTNQNSLTPQPQPQQFQPQQPSYKPPVNNQPIIPNNATPVGQDFNKPTVKEVNPANKNVLPPNYNEKKEKTKKLCEYAISELDFKRPKQARQHLIEALAILDSLE